MYSVTNKVIYLMVANDKLFMNEITFFTVVCKMSLIFSSKGERQQECCFFSKVDM